MADISGNEDSIGDNGGGDYQGDDEREDDEEDLGVEGLFEHNSPRNVSRTSSIWSKRKFSSVGRIRRARLMMRNRADPSAKSTITLGRRRRRQNRRIVLGNATQFGVGSRDITAQHLQDSISWRKSYEDGPIFGNSRFFRNDENDRGGSDTRNLVPAFHSPVPLPSMLKEEKGFLPNHHPNASAAPQFPTSQTDSSSHSIVLKNDFDEHSGYSASVTDSSYSDDNDEAAARSMYEREEAALFRPIVLFHNWTGRSDQKED